LAIHRSLAIHLVELRARIGNGQFVMSELRGNPLGHFVSVDEDDRAG